MGYSLAASAVHGNAEGRSRRRRLAGRPGRSGDTVTSVGDVAGLDELIGRYLSPAIPVHREDSTVEAVVDGCEWMRRMRQLLTSAGPGDAAYLCGLQLDHDMDLTGRAPGEPGYGMPAGFSSAETVLTLVGPP
jgi:hypothetical protein